MLFIIKEFLLKYCFMLFRYKVGGWFYSINVVIEGKIMILYLLGLDLILYLLINNWYFWVSFVMFLNFILGVILVFKGVIVFFLFRVVIEIKWIYVYERVF